ncbi:MAG TPA: DUF885 family protein, partial [Pyrinomonadaceae bacterium]
MKTLAFCLLIFFCLVSGAPAQATEAEKLHALFAREWERTLEANPTFASFLGDKRYNTRWAERSLEAISAQNKRRIDALAELKRIDRSRLSPADRVNYDLFKDGYESGINNYNTRLYLLPISQRGG